MEFKKFNWVDRVTENPNRRRLVDTTTGSDQVVDIYRDEGNILQSGTPFTADNMNGLENRIADEFSKIPISGTWTPILESYGVSSPVSPTYTGTVRGLYRKIGDLIYISCTILNININNTPNGYARISGLPFSANDHDFYSLAVSQNYGLLINDNIGARIQGGQVISLSESIYSGVTTQWKKGTGTLLISGFYIQS